MFHASIQIAVAETLILNFVIWLYLNSLLYLCVIYANQSVVIHRLFQMALRLLILLSNNLPNLFLFHNFFHQQVSLRRIILQLVQLLTVNAFVEHKLVLYSWNQLKLPALLLKLICPLAVIFHSGCNSCTSVISLFSYSTRRRFSLVHKVTLCLSLLFHLLEFFHQDWRLKQRVNSNSETVVK